MAGLTNACSPSYDWRELMVDDQLQAWLPCKPESRSRKAPLAGRPAAMQLLSCEAQGAVWGVLSVDLGDGASADAALHELNAAISTNLGAQPAVLGPAQVAGLPAGAPSQRILARGKRPDGSAVQVEAWAFTHGKRVYQASLTQLQPAAAGAASQARPHEDEAGGTQAQRQARDTFFSSLKFKRP